MRIISGGQTGVDRGALDAAMDSGAACGGWCPTDRRAEDGPLSEHYPLKALPDAGYKQRTRQNVMDSDATLIIYFHKLEGGTAYTLQLCRQQHKPFFTIDAGVTAIETALADTQNFIKLHGIEQLNVAGPRASKEAKAYPYSYRLIDALLNNRNR